MSSDRTWFITGASRGFGLNVARTALDAGDRVVATARHPEQVSAALGDDDRLLTVALDVTEPGSIAAGVDAALRRFGRIDVLVNNAGYGQLGFFEEVSPESIARQFATNVFGVFDVTRAVLPTLRAQRSGHIVTIASIAGIVGGAGSSVYGASKFAVTGWSEGLSLELAPFGIRATVVHPGMFRTDFLDPSSVLHADRPIDDYTSERAARRSWLDGMNHAQLGDPDRFGASILQLVDLPEPPARWGVGSDAVEAFLQRADELGSSVAEFEAAMRATDVRA